MTKWDFIDKMEQIARDICSKRNLEVLELSECCDDETLAELKRWIRFYIINPATKHGGEIDLDYNQKTYSIRIANEFEEKNLQLECR